jgi:hypothetical protein
MKTKKSGLFAGIAGMAPVFIGMLLVLAACADPNGDIPDSGNSGGVDYTSYNTNYSILVRNNTGQNLVAFKGALEASKLIGGIPAHAQGHGLKNDPALFNRTEDFPLVLITEAQYKANKSTLSALTQTPFTRIYVFYNAAGDNTTHYEISGRLGGENQLIIENTTGMNVELRLGGIAGETIGYAPAGTLRTTLYMNGGDADIFPVFKRYNPLRDTIDVVYPKGAGTGQAWFQSIVLSSSAQTFDVSAAFNSTQRSTGVAWLVINNQTYPAEAVRLYEGSTPQETASGQTYISSGNQWAFQVDMPTVPNTTNKYAESKTVSSYKIGPSANSVSIETKAGGAATFDLSVDKMYTVTVTGNHNDGTLSAEIDIAGAIAIDMNDFVWN